MPNQSWNGLTVESENLDSTSVLNLYRNALAFRAEFFAGAGEIKWLESPLHGSNQGQLLGFKRGQMTVYMNLSNEEYALDFNGQVIISSNGNSIDLNEKQVIPARSTVWIL